MDHRLACGSVMKDWLLSFLAAASIIALTVWTTRIVLLYWM